MLVHVFLVCMLLGVHEVRSLKGRCFPWLSGAWASRSPGQEDPADGREVQVAQRVLFAGGQAAPALLGLAGVCKDSVGAAASRGGKRRELNCVSGLLFIDPYSRSTVIPGRRMVAWSS